MRPEKERNVLCFVCKCEDSTFFYVFLLFEPGISLCKYVMIHSPAIIIIMNVNLSADLVPKRIAEASLVHNGNAVYVICGLVLNVTNLKALHEMLTIHVTPMMLPPQNC